MSQHCLKKMWPCICDIFYFVRMHPKIGNLWLFCIFPPILIIYTRMLTITNGTFSHLEKYSNMGFVPWNIPALSLFPKKWWACFQSGGNIGFSWTGLIIWVNVKQNQGTHIASFIYSLQRHQPASHGTWWSWYLPRIWGLGFQL